MFFSAPSLGINTDASMNEHLQSGRPRQLTQYWLLGMFEALQAVAL